MFTIRNYQSEERYDLAKFMEFTEDVYDAVNSPFLLKFLELPTTSYYSTNSGYKNIDEISQDAYGNPFYSFLILYYNNLFEEVIPENVNLKLFSLDDLDNLYYDLSNGSL